MLGFNWNTTDKVTGASIHTLKGFRRQMVSKQTTAPYPFKPSSFYCNYCVASTEKSDYIFSGGLRSSIVSHSRTIAWNQIVAHAIGRDGPYNRIRGVVRRSRVESLDTAVFAEMKQHAFRMIQSRTHLTICGNGSTPRSNAFFSSNDIPQY